MSKGQAMADVLIIGAGPTGAVAAKRFAEAGMSVVVLEQGDWPDYTQARADHADVDDGVMDVRSAAPGECHPTAVLRAAGADELGGSTRRSPRR